MIDTHPRFQMMGSVTKCADEGSCRGRTGGEGCQVDVS